MPAASAASDPPPDVAHPLCSSIRTVAARKDRLATPGEGGAALGADPRKLSIPTHRCHPDHQHDPRGELLDRRALQIRSIQSERPRAKNGQQLGPRELDVACRLQHHTRPLADRGDVRQGQRPRRTSNELRGRLAYWELYASRTRSLSMRTNTLLPHPLSLHTRRARPRRPQPHLSPRG
jgi:hypothetical protein